MPVASMRELLEAGVHFGHQTRRWNPKMRRFIFTERSGIYIIDLTQTQLAVREARRLNMPVIALVDTNCDPDEADYVIPGNDDAIRSCGLIARVIADAIEQGKQKIAVKEFKPAASNGAEAPPATAEETVSDTEPEIAEPGVQVDAPDEVQQ